MCNLEEVLKRAQDFEEILGSEFGTHGAEEAFFTDALINRLVTSAQLGGVKDLIMANPDILANTARDIIRVFGLKLAFLSPDAKKKFRDLSGVEQGCTPEVWRVLQDFRIFQMDYEDSGYYKHPFHLRPGIQIGTMKGPDVLSGDKIFIEISADCSEFRWEYSEDELRDTDWLNISVNGEVCI